MFDNNGPPPKLMYRRPNGVDYENITDVLDDILNKLDDLDKRLSTLEDRH